MEGEDKPSEQWTVVDLCYEIARQMPVEAVAKEMLQDCLLTTQQWETYTTKTTEERGEYLLDCLQKCKPGYLKKFCSILKKVGAHNLEETIIQHREVVSKAPHASGPNMTHEMRYWRLKYWKGEKLIKDNIKKHNEEVKKLQDHIQDLTFRANQEFQSMIVHLQNHIRRNKGDLLELKHNNPTDSDLQPSEHSDLSNSRQRQKHHRISVDSSSTCQPYSSHESLNSSATTSVSSNSDHGIPTDDDHVSLSQPSNFSNMMLKNQVQPFPYLRSGHNSDEMQEVDGRSGIGSQIDPYDDDDDRASDVTIISTSVELEGSSQGDGSELHRDEPRSHEEEQNSQSDTTESHSEETLSHREEQHVDSHRNEQDSHRDEPGSHSEEFDSHSDEPAELQEYRRVHSRITGKYRK